MVKLVLSLSLFFKFHYWFCHLDCHFLSVDAGCDGCQTWGRQRLLNPEHLVVLSAGPIPHNSIHLLIITTDFVALYWFTGYVVFIITSFLAGVESADQCLFSSKVLSCFSGVIMSIRSFFLLYKRTTISKKSKQLNFTFWSSFHFVSHTGRPGQILHYLVCILKPAVVQKCTK